MGGLISFTGRKKCFGLYGGIFGFCRLYLAEVVGLKKVVV